MQRKTALLALAGCLTILLAIGSLAAAPAPQKIAQLKFSGALSTRTRSTWAWKSPVHSPSRTSRPRMS